MGFLFDVILLFKHDNYHKIIKCFSLLLFDIKIIFSYYETI